jgi:hypothetical protein
MLDVVAAPSNKYMQRDKGSSCGQNKRLELPDAERRLELDSDEGREYLKLCFPIYVPVTGCAE